KFFNFLVNDYMRRTLILLSVCNAFAYILVGILGNAAYCRSYVHNNAKIVEMDNKMIRVSYDPENRMLRFTDVIRQKTFISNASFDQTASFKNIEAVADAVFGDGQCMILASPK